MELTVIGCTGSMPGPDSPASCYLVQHEGFVLLLDLGNGALGALMRFIDLRTIDAIVLSHLHADHCIDLTSLYVARKYGGYGGEGRLPVLGPGDTATRMARAYDLPVHPGMSTEFEFIDLSSASQVGPFGIGSAPMAHPVTATAIRLDVEDVALAYTGDTGPNDRIVPLVTGVDLLVAEASFVDGADNPRNLHLTGRQAGEIARDAGVGHLVLTHVPPWHDGHRAVAEAAEVFDGPISLAHSGLRVDVGGR
ncbi:MAG: MBL fold metallo-hydrolase [Actinomycetes bacterium]